MTSKLNIKLIKISKLLVDCKGGDVICSVEVGKNLAQKFTPWKPIQNILFRSPNEVFEFEYNHKKYPKAYFTIYQNHSILNTFEVPLDNLLKGEEKVVSVYDSLKKAKITVELTALNFYSSPVFVVVVGAGPVGLSLANSAAKEGASVCVLEKRSIMEFAKRRQEVNLDQESVNLLQDILGNEELDSSCKIGDNGWKSIPIGKLQLMLFNKLTQTGYKERVTIHFDSTLEYNNDGPLCYKENGKVKLFDRRPRLIHICDGKSGDTASSFNFHKVESPEACTSTMAVIVTLECSENCLSKDCFSAEGKNQSVQLEDGTFDVRVYATKKNLYLAYGAGQNEKAKNSLDIIKGEKNGYRKTLKMAKKIYKELMNHNKEKSSPHEEFPDFKSIETSGVVEIKLGHRSATVKRFKQHCIVSIEGDNARWPNFFSGSGLNAGLEDVKNAKILLRGIEHDNNICDLIDKKCESSKKISEQVEEKSRKFTPCLPRKEITNPNPPLM